MKQYLLSIYQPDADPLPPDKLEQITRDGRSVTRNGSRLRFAKILRVRHDRPDPT